MPTIASFYGIVIMMFLLDKEHNPPHIHAFYGEFEASFTFNDGSIKEYDFKNLFNKYPIFKRLKDETNLFINGYVASGGRGIIFDDELDIASEEIYNNGVLLEQRKVESINMQIANIISKARTEKNMT